MESNLKPHRCGHLELLDKNEMPSIPCVNSDITPDFDEQVGVIAAALSVLTQDFPWFEIRAKHKSLGAVSGCFNDVVEAAEQAAVLDLDEYDVYFGINPTDFHLMPKPLRLNVVGQGRALNDSQILCRRRLLIDIDPIRPAGVSATDDEKASAQAVATKVVDYLTAAGWSAPLSADSGNGVHLHYKADLPANDEGQLHRVLSVLAARFDTDHAKIDTTVGNASRSCRLYRTRNRKGPDTQDRPHRMAKITSIPADWRSVPAKLLHKVACIAGSLENGVANSQLRAVAQPESGFTPITRQTANEALIARAHAKLHTLPIAIQGQGGSNACFRAACVLASEFGLEMDEAFPVLQGYNTRCRPPFSDKELAHKLKDAIKKARELPEDVSKARPDAKESRSSSERLMDIVAARFELWHDATTRDAYATIAMPTTSVQPNSWHKANCRVDSTDFSGTLRYIDFTAHGRLVPAQALREAVETCAAIAKFQRPGNIVHLRVGRVEEAVYLDLGDEQWRGVEIDAAGWRIVGEPPSKFRRSQGMLPLPAPEGGGSLKDFQDLFNLESQADLMLIIGWLVMCLHGYGPFPVLSLIGEQGSAKSTTAEMIRSLVDPTKAGLQSLAKDDRELMIGATNQWILAFDNLSGVDGADSDRLCRLATGSAFSTRKLYTDSEEALFEACRPVILTGISEIAKRADLLDRSIVIQLPSIDEAKRRAALEVKDRFRALRPKMLGLLLDGVVCAIANFRTLKLDSRLRMADFQQWAAAAMPAFGWTPEAFVEAYSHNVDVANGIALEDTPVAPALSMLLKACGGRWPNPGEIRGAQALLTALQGLPGTNFASQTGWPQKANTLGQILQRLAPVFRRSGIQIRIGKRQTTGARITPIEIEAVALQASGGSPSPAAGPAPTSVATVESPSTICPAEVTARPVAKTVGQPEVSDKVQHWLALQGY